MANTFLDMAADSPVPVLSGTHGILLNDALYSTTDFMNGVTLCIICSYNNLSIVEIIQKGKVLNHKGARIKLIEFG